MLLVVKWASLKMGCTPKHCNFNGEMIVKHQLWEYYELVELGLEKQNVTTTTRSHTIGALCQERTAQRLTPRVFSQDVTIWQDEPSWTCHTSSGITFPPILLVYLSVSFLFLGLASQVQSVILFSKLVGTTGYHCTKKDCSHILCQRVCQLNRSIDPSNASIVSSQVFPYDG